MNWSQFRWSTLPNLQNFLTSVTFKLSSIIPNQKPNQLETQHDGWKEMDWRCTSLLAIECNRLHFSLGCLPNLLSFFWVGGQAQLYTCNSDSYCCISTIESVGVLDPYIDKLNFSNFWMALILGTFAGGWSAGSCAWGERSRLGHFSVRPGGQLILIWTKKQCDVCALLEKVGGCIWLELDKLVVIQDLKLKSWMWNV